MQQTPLPGRVDALLVRRAARADDRRRPSTTRCSARAASGTRAGRPSTEHGPSRSTSGSSTRTAGSCSTPTRTARRRTTWPTSIPKVQELEDLWFEEAKKYDVLPLNDLGIFEFRALEYQIAVPASGQYTYYPGTTEVPEASAANTLNRVVQDPRRGRVRTATREGVIFAQGSRFGGHSLFVKDGKLIYVYNFLGIPPSRRSSDGAVAGHAHRRRRVHQGAHGRAPRVARTAEAVRRRPGRRRGRDPHDRVPLRAVRRGSVHRLRRRRRGQPASTRRSSRSPAAGSSRSSSTSPTTPTSTSRPTSPPRSPGVSATVAAEELLASWNDTPTRQGDRRLRGADHRRRPRLRAAEARIATFDNDGTLWCEKPLPIQLAFILQRLAAMATDRRCGSASRGRRRTSRTTPGSAASSQALRRRRQRREGADGRHAAGFAGMTVDEYVDGAECVRARRRSTRRWARALALRLPADGRAAALPGGQRLHDAHRVRR